ncbi:MAG TPA: phasin family protein [Rickettsia endosymbiont of Columbicola hoogstraali]|nr:phasin family protein [Rickettsia endosymbiont of Columbicola hoogstraali]
MNSTKEAMGTNDFKQASDCHQKCFKSIYETSMNNAKEIANIAYESSAKILEAVNTKIFLKMFNKLLLICRIWHSKHKKTYLIKSLLRF